MSRIGQKNAHTAICCLFPWRFGQISAFEKISKYALPEEPGNGSVFGTSRCNLSCHRRRVHSHGGPLSDDVQLRLHMQFEKLREQMQKSIGVTTNGVFQSKPTFGSLGGLPPCTVQKLKCGEETTFICNNGLAHSNACWM